MTTRNVPYTLVDCGCETTVYSDGSGVEIHYCPLHTAAPELLAACEMVLSWFESPHAGRDVLLHGMVKTRHAIKKAKGLGQ